MKNIKYIKQKKIISAEKVERIIADIVKKYELSDYVKYLIINEQTDEYSQYIYDNKELVIGYKKIKNNHKNNPDINFILLYNIYHEIEHALQYKKYDELGDFSCLEDELLFLLIEELEDLDEDNNIDVLYEYLLTERLANIYAFRKLKEIYTNLGDKKYVKYAEKLEKSLLNGYNDKKMGPTNYLFSQLKMETELEELLEKYKTKTTDQDLKVLGIK